MAALTIYFDRCFGTRLPKALFMLRPPFTVEWHESRTNRFRQQMPDDEWLAICGRRGWVAFTHDRKFHSIAVEAEAIRQHNVAAFALCGAQNESFDKLWYFIKAYLTLLSVIEQNKPPYFYRIDQRAKFEKVQLA